MKTLPISIPEKPALEYHITIGRGIFGDLLTGIPLAGFSKSLLVVDGAVSRFHNDTFKKIPSITIPQAGEEQKTPALLSSLWEQFQQHRLDRASVVIAVGGGATCDVVGFAASTYMRGIACINVPTTLLSQVDSSIGGKTGINIGKIKNLVGTFASPKAVWIDIEFLKTLPGKEFISGVAEVLKHGIIRDNKLWMRLAANPLLSAEDPALEEIIELSLRIKKDVVEQDPFENGLRKILNFGHTIGHAYETVSHLVGTPLLHGEAVSLGMVQEARLAARLGLLPQDAVQQITAVLARHGLPVEPAAYRIEDVLAVMEKDKKNQDGKFLFALPPRIGECGFGIEVSREAVLSVMG